MRDYNMNYFISLEIEWQSDKEISADVRGAGKVHECYMTSLDGKKSMYVISDKPQPIGLVAKQAIAHHKQNKQMPSQEEVDHHKKLWEWARRGGGDQPLGD